MFRILLGLAVLFAGVSQANAARPLFFAHVSVQNNPQQDLMEGAYSTGPIERIAVAASTAAAEAVSANVINKLDSILNQGLTLTIGGQNARAEFAQVPKEAAPLPESDELDIGMTYRCDGTSCVAMGIMSRKEYNDFNPGDLPDGTAYRKSFYLMRPARSVVATPNPVARANETPKPMTGYVVRSSFTSCPCNCANCTCNNAPQAVRAVYSSSMTTYSVPYKRGLFGRLKPARRW